MCYKARTTILATDCMKRWLIKLWTGGYTLPVAFWVWLILVPLAVKAPLSQLDLSTDWLLLKTAVLLAYSLCAWVGVWRSAATYRGGRGWVLAAKAVVCVQVVANALLVSGRVWGWWSWVWL